MIQAVIFDVGGTLVKTDSAILEALRLALLENGVVFTNQMDVVNVFGQGQMKNVRCAVEGSYQGVDINEKVEKCFALFQKLFPSYVMDRFEVIEHVFYGLDELKKKGMKLVVLTGFDRRETTFFLERMGLARYFDLVLCAEDIVMHRPNPRGLLLVVEQMAVKKEEVLYVGDAWVDIQFARNAGVKVACVKTGAQDNALLEQEKPDYLVENFKELVEKVNFY
jgi:phosphoglycolate phosphatase